MLQARLRVIDGKHEGHVIPLTQHKFLIGRERDCQLRTGSEMISRHHCVFTQDDYSVRLRDLGSTNGTFVNGERIRGEVILKTGDEVRVGKLAFIIEIPAVPVAEKTPPPPVAAGLDFVLAGAAEGESAPATDTTYEIPVSAAAAEPAPSEPAPAEVGSGDTVVVETSDTAVIPAYTGPAQPPQQPAFPQAPPGYYPQPQQPYYDPYQQPAAYYPPQGQYPYPGYYPQQYGGGYPPQMPGYYPPQGQYPYAPQPAAPEQSAAAAEVDPLPVKLPDPSETGAKAPAPTAAAKSTNPSEKTPSQKAAELIQKMQRRG